MLFVYFLLFVVGKQLVGYEDMTLDELLDDAAGFPDAKASGEEAEKELNNNDNDNNDNNNDDDDDDDNSSSSSNNSNNCFRASDKPQRQ